MRGLICTLLLLITGIHYSSAQELNVSIIEGFKMTNADLTPPHFAEELELIIPEFESTVSRNMAENQGEIIEVRIEKHE